MYIEEIAIASSSHQGKTRHTYDTLVAMQKKRCYVHAQHEVHLHSSVHLEHTSVYLICDILAYVRGKAVRSRSAPEDSLYSSIFVRKYTHTHTHSQRESVCVFRIQANQKS